MCTRGEEFRKLVEQPLQRLLLGAAEQLPEDMRAFLETRTPVRAEIGGVSVRSLSFPIDGHLEEGGGDA